MDKHFLVGASIVESTPVPSLRMDGYKARVDASTGIHDPLIVEALVLEYGHRRAALVTLYVMAGSRSFTDDVRRDLAAVLSTSQDPVLICASPL